MTETKTVGKMAKGRGGPLTSHWLCLCFVDLNITVASLRYEFIFTKVCVHVKSIISLPYPSPTRVDGAANASVVVHTVSRRRKKLPKIAGGVGGLLGASADDIKRTIFGLLSG